ncbi:MAG: homocysteine S-methyltransferase family protein [Anaerolineae bacterium]
MLSLQERLGQGDTILLDGATGTELQRRQIPTPLPLWSAAALINQPEAVRQIHLDYLAAGADILTANSFRTYRRTLARAGLGDRAQTLTYRAATLAIQARRDAGLRSSVLIAGSMSPLEDCYAPHLVPTQAECEVEHDEMARYLAAAGVDLILVETMNTIREAVAAASAAQRTGLPFMVSFVCGNNQRLLSGETLGEAVAALAPLDPLGLLVNCMSTPAVLSALQELRAVTDRPIGAYANVGHAQSDWGWDFTEDISAEAYGRHVRSWLAIGAQIVGGCCGTTPAHIAILADVIYDHAEVSNYRPVRNREFVLA